VIFTGSRTDVGQLLQVMDVFALTSYTECCPMALLEAMASGVPAVCTAVGGVPEMIDEGSTGYTVPSRDPAALAVRLTELMRDPTRAKAMGIAARRRLETDFSLERSIENAEFAIEKTAGRH
jgi:glycosyltransferase involved in cell wall biosynthesis